MISLATHGEAKKEPGFTKAEENTSGRLRNATFRYPVFSFHGHFFPGIRSLERNKERKDRGRK